MRSNKKITVQLRKGQKLVMRAGKMMGKILGLGMEGRQWAASLLICLMLLPLFSLPAGAASQASGLNAGELNPNYDNSGDFEPVNEELPAWKKTWREVNAKVEAWTTPLRFGNVITASSGDDKKEETTKKDENTENKDTLDSSDKISESSESSLNKSDSTSSKIPEAVGTKANNLKKTAVTAKSVLMNQLPDDERDSVYSYENNLGHPYGQVEKDSSNQAAATEIEHRAGIANFSFGVPFASLSGRGINAGAGMTYNSRTWNESCIQYDSQGVCSQKHFTYDVEQSWIAPGFSTGFGYLETMAATQRYHNFGSSHFYNFTEIIPLGVIDADGTRHQLICSSGTVITNTDGYRCDTYSSTDGSFITIPGRGWVANPNNSQTVNLNAYQGAIFDITYPGGTKISYGNGFGGGSERKHYPYKIQDRNGNYISIAYKSDQSGRIDYIRDTLSRDIKFYYENDSNGNPDKLVAVTIPGMGTGEEIQTVRFYYDDMQLPSDGFITGSQITAPSTIRVLKYVYMPATKTGYKYEYHPKFGMIKKITRQVGMTASTTATDTTGTLTEGVFAASTEYDYPSGSSSVNDVPKYTKRTDDWQGRTSTSPQETLYDSPEPVPGQDIVSQITVKDNSFDVMTETRSYNMGDWKDGLVKETSTKRVGNGTVTEKLMSKTVFTWAQGSTAFGGRQNPKLQKIEVTNEAGLTQATEFDYDQYNNQKTVKEYDYGTSNPTLLRTTEIEYETGAGWISNNLLNLPKSVKRIVGGVTVSKTLYEYDHNGDDSTLTKYNDLDNYDQSYNALNPPRTCERICDEQNVPSGYNIEEENPNTSGNNCHLYCSGIYKSNTKYRGNVTKVTAFSDATQTSDTNASVNEFEYDIAGNKVSATLNCCQLKTISYGANFAETGYAYPVSETKGTSPTQLTNSVSYNRNTGLVLTSTDANNQITSYEYETDTLRPKKTTYPNGGYALTEYSDKIETGTNFLPGYVRQTATLDTNKTVQSYSYFNGRGLGIRNAVQTPDGWSVSVVEYDKLGRPFRSYNPFYSSTGNGGIPTGTKYTEVTDYDGLGRTQKVKLQDDTEVESFINEAAVTYTDASNQSRIGIASRATDQAGKECRQIVDALGRIARVDEPTSAGLGLATAPNQPTFYEYDGNDNLSKIVQKDGSTVQERVFKYDSLSRLTHERQVEANPTLADNGTYGAAAADKWTKVLKYDAFGRTTQATDARGVTTNFTLYDGLNRLKTVAFSDGTPAINYTYDQTRTGFYNKGALTRVETAAGGTNRPDTPATATEFDYDKMGQIRQHRQTIGAESYNLEYNYNLGGQLTSEKYPSGKIVTNGYDASGRLASISDQSRTYLNSLQYASNGGALSQMTLGNGIQQSFDYNDRLQMKQMNWAKNGSVIQRYNYTFGELNSQNELKNNGKLAQIDSYNGGSTTNPTKQFTQKFDYDAVGRLKTETETRGDNNQQSYKQVFDYDNFGNRYLKAADNPSSQNPLMPTPIEANNIDKNTNHLASNTGTTYDDAGNVVQDQKFRSLKYSYDANGRMYKTSTVDDINQANSVYDAYGIRVASQINGVWKFFVYDVTGKMIAEYGGISSTDEGGVKYIHQDTQGSTRAITSSSGTVKARTDYAAFGEEIQSSIGQRTAQDYTSSNSLQQKYALTERDEASGLDQAWFRKNENRAGRWTSPDPYNGSMNLGDPQSFNRYAYVENQPTNFIDPSGLNMAPYVSVKRKSPDIDWSWWDSEWEYWDVSNGGDSSWLYDPTDTSVGENSGNGAAETANNADTCTLVVYATAVSLSGSSSTSSSSGSGGSPTQGSTGRFNHLYLTTTDSKTGLKVGFRGGPLKETGNLSATFGIYDKMFTDYEENPIGVAVEEYNGTCDDLNASLFETSNLLNKSNIKYEATGNNSNAFLYTALNRAGINADSFKERIDKGIGTLGFVPGWGNTLPLK